MKFHKHARILFSIFMLFLANIACDLERNYGDLSVNTAFEFEPVIGEEHYWHVTVIPDKRYQITIISTEEDRNTVGNEITIAISDGQDCKSCKLVWTVEVTKQGFNVEFTPSTTKLYISLYWNRLPIRSAILVSDISTP